MTDMTWRGMMPAITTPFRDDLTVDHEALAEHVLWLADEGAAAIVPLGSLGEGATLTFDEKLAVLDTCVGALGDRIPVAPGIASPSTAEAVRLAQEAKERGCRGLMALPPYVHRGPWPEMRAHFSAVIEATPLSCMLYNNPIAYGTDVTPEQIAELAGRHENLHAVKESSGDVRRITALEALLEGRLAISAGLDDIVVEGIRAGAEGWVAGLVNALPRESRRLFELAREGRREDADRLYAWFLPLLRLDTVPEFVQLIKLVQQEVGRGSERVRPPRLTLSGRAREEALAVIRSALERRPDLG